MNLFKQKYIISKVWSGKELCKDLGFVENKEGLKIAIELYESKKYNVIPFYETLKEKKMAFVQQGPYDKLYRNLIKLSKSHLAMLVLSHRESIEKYCEAKRIENGRKQRK